MVQKTSEKNPSLKRSNAFKLVKDEHQNVRENVGMLDITGFSRFEISGSGANEWLNKLFATRLPKKNNARLAVMLTENGKLKGDLTCFNWGNGTYWIMGSYYLRQWHMRWFKDNLPANSKT